MRNSIREYRDGQELCWRQPTLGGLLPRTDRPAPDRAGVAAVPVRLREVRSRSKRNCRTRCGVARSRGAGIVAGVTARFSGSAALLRPTVAIHMNSRRCPNRMRVPRQLVWKVGVGIYTAASHLSLEGHLVTS